MKIIYIANIGVNNRSAASYQTLCSANCIAKNPTIDVDLIIPKDSCHINKGTTPHEWMKGIVGKDRVSNKLVLKTIPYLLRGNCAGFYKSRYFFLMRNLAWSARASFGCIGSSKNCILTRDALSMLFLALLKAIGILNSIVIYEAHEFSLIRKYASKYIDGVICLNRLLQDMYDHENSIVAHDGYWLDEVNSSMPDETSGMNRIFYGGSLKEGKGIGKLLRLAKILDNYIFYVATVENLTGDAVPIDWRLSNIVWLGYISKEDMRVILHRKCAFCILPNEVSSISSNYTSPMKLFEYAAARKALVLAPIPSVVELLKPSDYIKLGDSDESIRRAAAEIMLCNPKKLGEAAGARLSDFSWEVRSAKIIDFIRKIMLSN